MPRRRFSFKAFCQAIAIRPATEPQERERQTDNGGSGDAKLFCSPPMIVTQNSLELNFDILADTNVCDYRCDLLCVGLQLRPARGWQNENGQFTARKILL
jgi:hypothetical protein